MPDARASVPMSPLPAPLRSSTGAHRLPAATDPAWEVPHEADDSAAAVAWRARRGMRIAVEARELFGALAARVEALTSQIAATDATWSARWATLARIGWPVLIALCIAGALGVAGGVWHFVSTLHH